MSTLKSSAENLTLNADGRGNDIKFQSNAVEKASIDQDGNVIAAGTISSTGDTTITTGDLVFATSGKGVCLGVTSNTDANTLDDYEEGTWTPTYGPESGSFTTLTLVGATPGRYVKVGKKVTCWWYLGTSAANLSGASGDLYITGLPFANETVGAGNWGTGLYSTKWGGDQPTVALINSSESFIRLTYRASHNADLSDLQTTDLDTGSDSNYTRGWITYNT